MMIYKQFPPNTERSIKVSFQGDVLTVAFYKPGEAEPYVQIRTRGQESNEVIADLKKHDERGNG